MADLAALRRLSRRELRMLGQNLLAGLNVVADVSPETAIELKALYPVWKKGEPGNPIHYAADGTCYVCPFDGNLYKVRNGMDHNAPDDDNYAPSRYQAGWEPVVQPGDDGSREHPITFVSGMAVTASLYYKQGNLLCRCTRSEAHLYGELANFVGSYMEIVT